MQRTGDHSIGVAGISVGDVNRRGRDAMRTRVAVRIGAAAFVAGVSLAVPMSAGVAAAHPGDSGSAPVPADTGRAGTEASGAPSPRTPGRLTQSRRSGESPVATPRRALPKPAAAARAAGNTQPSSRADRPARQPALSRLTDSLDGFLQGGPPAAQADAAPPAPVPPGPAAPALIAAPAAAPTAPVAAAVRAGVGRCPNCWVIGPRQVVRGVATSVERLLDTTGRVVSGLPGNVLTDFTSGALWLVRRSLFPVGSDVGRWGSAACVATKDCTGQDLSGADLKGQDLSEVDFTRANLASAILEGTNLTDAKLVSAALTGTDFRKADLRGADLSGVSDADLISARWSEAILRGQNFSGRRLSYGIRRIGFIGADLTDASLSGTYLVGAYFSRADLTRTDISNSSLQGATFAEAVMVDANLTGVVASTNRGYQQTIFDKADLTGADLTGARLARAMFYRANLTEADLTRADLTDASLYRAVLTGVTWKDTTCPNGSKTNTGCSGSSVALLRDRVDGTYVYFYNRTDQTLAVVQIPDGGRNDPESDPRYLAPGEKSDFYGDNNGAKNMDVRLRIYSATQDDTGAWQKGEMKEIITATNRWILSPYARVQMDPKRDGSVARNRHLEKEFGVNDNWFADYDLKGPIQSGQTGTFMLRLSDRDDDYKLFQIEVFKIPGGSTQDYDLFASTEGG